MKYVILVGDGMGDYPVAELGGRTPLEAAATPHLDLLAGQGELGLARTIPVGMEAGSDIANLSIMGYDPARYHTGRAPLEAAALGVDLGPGEMAFRCNLVTLRQEDSRLIMEDYSAGHIDSAEARELITALEAALGRDGRHFYPGVSYRHLLVWTEGEAGWRTYPPHDLTGQEVGRLITFTGPERCLWELVRESWLVLKDHDINRHRLAQGKRPATSIWLWGQGRPPQLPTLKERFGLTGAVISAVDLIKGIGIYAGLKPIRVPGATGYLDTNYAGKVAATLEALRHGDLVYLHVEAPDEAGHSGDLALKIKALEDFDSQVVGPLMAGLKELGDHRLLVLCDHLTPIAVRTHTPEPVPFILDDSRRPENHPRPYTEAAAKESGLLLEQGADLLLRLLGRDDELIKSRRT
jgi:2,3-bisphosphoglycerate-independent phosphoglycerate mutase